MNRLFLSWSSRSSPGCVKPSCPAVHETRLLAAPPLAIIPAGSVSVVSRMSASASSVGDSVEDCGILILTLMPVGVLAEL